jgi:hypothetical protein
MKARTLVLLPIVVVVAFLAAWALVPVPARDPLLFVEVESSKALALLGFAAAALVFESGDYLRRAWMLLGACTLLLFARDVFAVAAHPGHGDSAALVVQGAFAIGGNGCSVLGTWMLARTWKVAGLDEGQSRRGNGLVIAAVVVAVLIDGWPVVTDVRALAVGDVSAVVPLASDIADALVVILLAPLASTALALRGGALLWPWAFLTLNGLLWLVFDVTYGGLTVAHVDPARSHAVLEAMRTLATLYGFSAGFSQRNVRAVGAPA